MLVLKIILLCFLLLASVLTMRAQSMERQVVAAGGNTAIAAGIQIDFTIGEPVITPISGSGLLLTQGFQQPFSYTLQSGAVFPFLALYPNPTQGNTILHFALPAEGSLLVMVHNAIGQRVLNETVHYGSGETQYIVKTAPFVPGTYFVTIRLEGFGVVSKKLIKVDK
jgi:hypothetical protein